MRAVLKANDHYSVFTLKTNQSLGSRPTVVEKVIPTSLKVQHIQTCERHQFATFTMLVHVHSDVK